LHNILSTYHVNDQANLLGRDGKEPKMCLNIMSHIRFS
jgi:hypothetical protein